MLHFSRWQTAVVLGITALACLAALPNVLPAHALERLPQWAQRKIELGYDLRGGEHIQLAVDTAYVRRELLEQLRGEVRGLMREARAGYQGLQVRNGGVEFFVRDAETMPRVLSVLDTFMPPARSIRAREVPLLLDGRQSFTETRNAPALERDVTVDVADRMVRLEPTEMAVRRRIASSRRASADMIERRLAELGAPYRLWQTGEDRLAIDVPFPLERLPEH
jgi:preprotein translocase subunit SecD